MTIREFFERFGASIAVIVALVLLVVAMPGSGTDGPSPSADPAAVAAGATSPAATSNAASSDATGTLGADRPAAGVRSGGDAAPSGGAPASAADGGSVAAIEEVELAPPPASADCRPDGRQPGISAFMPPCQPLFRGDNGGATARGVTADEIKVVRYVQQEDPAVNAALTAAGADDSPEQIKDIFETLRHYHNHHYETYGREVVFVDVRASGPSDNEEAMRADAIRIAEGIGAFAAVTDTASSVLAEELAQRDVVVMRYNSLSRRQYPDLPLRIWSRYGTPELYYEHMAEYIGKRLHGRNAIHAGDDQSPLQSFRDQQRKFGLIWIEGVGSRVDPYAKGARDHFVNELAKYGATLAADASYTFDLPRQQQQSTNIISRMRAEGVTTLYFYGDPLYPAFLTREATRQNYFPEWLVSGLLLEDTTFFGRTYDQSQWAQAFGISPLYVFWENKRVSPGYREYFHMRPDAQPGDEGVGINTYRLDIQRLFVGIQMAGPTLTPDTFARGLLDYPPTGGDPANALWDFTETDPNSDKDFTEIWWNPDARGKDEADNEGIGIMMKSNGGRRYQLGEWPSADASVFEPEHSISITDNPEGVPWALPHEDVEPHTHPPLDAGGCRSCP